MVCIMTNKEAKEKAIRKAWEKYWDKVKENVIGMNMSGGWADNETIHYTEDLGGDGKDFEFCGCLYRPKSLSGIENNNGWTRIEPDGSNLPEINNSHTYYKVCFKEDDGSFKINDRHEYNAFQLDEMFRDGDHFTHYKPIEEEKPPIW